MPCTQSPLFAVLESKALHHRRRRDAYRELAKARRGVADVQIPEIRPVTLRSAETDDLLADQAERTAIEFETAAFNIDNEEGPARLLAIARAADLLRGFAGDRSMMAAFLASPAGGLTEDEADMAADLWKDAEP